MVCARIGVRYSGSVCALARTGISQAARISVLQVKTRADFMLNQALLEPLMVSVFRAWPRARLAFITAGGYPFLVPVPTLFYETIWLSDPCAVCRCADGYSCADRNIGWLQQPLRPHRRPRFSETPAGGLDPRQAWHHGD